MPTSPRPTPLADAANDVTYLHSWWIGASAAVVSSGIITLSTGNLIAALLGLIPGLIALIGTIVGARVVVSTATPLVTPLSDPVDNLGRKLLPAPIPPLPIPDLPIPDLPI